MGVRLPTSDGLPTVFRRPEASRRRTADGFFARAGVARSGAFHSSGASSISSNASTSSFCASWYARAFLDFEASSPESSRPRMSLRVARGVFCVASRARVALRRWRVRPRAPRPRVLRPYFEAAPAAGPSPTLAAFFDPSPVTQWKKPPCN